MQKLALRIFLIGCLALGLGLTLPGPQAASAQPGPGVFEPTDCMFELPGGTYDGQLAPIEGAYRVDCGWLTVPAQHGQPDGSTLRLAVGIVRSQAEQVQPDPLVMLQGGPGGSSIGTGASVLTHGNGWAYSSRLAASLQVE